MKYVAAAFAFVFGFLALFIGVAFMVALMLAVPIGLLGVISFLLIGGTKLTAALVSICAVHLVWLLMKFGDDEVSKSATVVVGAISAASYAWLALLIL